MMLENLLETTKALCTRGLFQRHVDSDSEGPVCLMHEFYYKGKT